MDIDSAVMWSLATGNVAACLTCCVHIQAASGLVYVPVSGSVVFTDGSSSAVSHVDIDNAAYLSVNSSFTVSLTAATYLGTYGL